MENQSPSNLNVLAIVGLVLSIFAFLFSFIPCVGFYAIGPSILAGAFCGFAFHGLREENKSTGVALAGIIIVVLTIVISLLQYYVFQEVFEVKNEIEESINSVEGEIQDAVIEGLIDAVEHELFHDSISDTYLDSTSIESVDTVNTPKLETTTE